MSPPAQRPGRSRQDYGTPPEFFAAASAMFGPFAVDLAADAANALCPVWVGAARDSLTVPWAETWAGYRCWLNPPFARIAPWAEKCAREGRSGLTVALLTPASVSTEWHAAHVHGEALVLFLRPRLTFVGQSEPYPKDLMLSVFGLGRAGYECWRWDA